MYVFRFYHRGNQRRCFFGWQQVLTFFRQQALARGRQDALTVFQASTHAKLLRAASSADVFPARGAGVPSATGAGARAGNERRRPFGRQRVPTILSGGSKCRHPGWQQAPTLFRQPAANAAAFSAGNTCRHHFGWQFSPTLFSAGNKCRFCFGRQQESPFRWATGADAFLRCQRPSRQHVPTPLVGKVPTPFRQQVLAPQPATSADAYSAGKACRPYCALQQVPTPFRFATGADVVFCKMRQRPSRQQVPTPP